MILTAEKHAKHADFLRWLIHDEVEHGIVFGYVSKPRHDPWLQRALKRNVAKPFQRILDAAKSICSTHQRFFDRITKVAICTEQMIEDDLEICVTG